MALVVSILDNSAEGIVFFSAAAPGAAIHAWAVREPYGEARRRVAIAFAVAWLVAAVWIGVLLVMYQSASRPPPEVEATYFGLTATAYRLVALYGGAVLVTIAAAAVSVATPPRSASERPLRLVELHLADLAPGEAFSQHFQPELLLQSSA
jgi:hypothetical protein